MNTKQLKYVCVLANEGTFSGAADVLNISQPSLSQYIKKIEQQTGVELFVRTNGNVKLTEAGKEYILAGQKILNIERELQTKIDEIAEYKRGTVTIGTTPFRSATMMPIIASMFKERYPGMYLTIVEKGTSELLECAEKGEFDFCIATMPERISRFCCKKIYEEEILLAVPYNDSLRERIDKNVVVIPGKKYKAVDAKIISNEAVVMITETQIMQKVLDDLCYELQISVKKAAVVKSLDAQIQMVRNGVGIALVPSGIAQMEYLNKDIVFYSLVQNIPRREVVMLYNKDSYLSGVTKDVMQMIQESKW